MGSVHQLHAALARMRDLSAASVEAYGRVLRAEGVLPETRRGGAATPATSLMAAQLLLATLRGSPVDAAMHARELGELRPHIDKILEPVLELQMRMLGWPSGMTCASAVAWLIQQCADDTLERFFDTSKGYQLEVDRYWPRAVLRFEPVLPMVEQLVAAWRAVNPVLVPERMSDGALLRPMEIAFASPLLHEMKITHGVDVKRNREANIQYSELHRRGAALDLHGSESVTERTINVLAQVFK